MQMRMLLAACLIAVAGCGDDGGGDPPVASVSDRDSGVGMRVCVDEDDDGYGNRYCELGRDCDDQDPEVTDLCYRCATANEGCPCEPGTDARPCDPPDIEVEGGVLVCEEGTRYCRDGFWSDCEVLGEYTFVATGQ